MIEQPFAANDLTSHIRLAASTTTPICLDGMLDVPQGPGIGVVVDSEALEGFTVRRALM